MAVLSHIGQVATPTTFHPSHQHDVWELVLYQSGTGSITVGSTPVPFAPGTIVCLPPRIAHSEQSSGGFTNIHVIFNRFSPPKSGIPVFCDDANHSFQLLAMHLLREFHVRQSGWEVICDNLADLLVCYLQRWAADAAPSPLVDRLRNLLVERLHEAGFSAGDAMRELPCSMDQARRQFVRVTGLTPTAFLTALRLQAAKRLLVAGARVHEAAEQVGLPDPYYFSRLFSRHEGMSPVQYQQSVIRSPRPS